MSLQDTRARLLGKFKEEADEHLLIMQRRLVDLEKDPRNRDYLREVFRSAHTIKGSARLMNFPEIAGLAHAMENIFAAMREEQLELRPAINDLLFEALDAVQQLAQAAVVGRPAARPATGDLIQRLDRLLEAEPEPDYPARPEPALTPARSVPEPEAGPASAGEAAGPPSTGPTSGRAGALNDEIIRVDVRKLDELMNISGELALDKLQAQTTLNNLRLLQELLQRRQRLTPDPDRPAPPAIRRELETLDRQIETVLNTTLRNYEDHAGQLVSRIDELENSVRAVRMRPLETIFQDFPLAVRNMARSNGREPPDFRQSGGEIELDKKVLEGLRDPLIHIVRNALDHGLEPPDARAAAGKQRAGRLTMTATQEGGFVYVAVSDDGAGIDPDLIRRVAVQKNFLPEARVRALPDSEILNLIYEPGFSTAGFITDLSGRGVGMEIVKTNLERLGGQVQVSSRKGQGTTVTLRAPLSVATSRALLVRSGGQSFALLSPAIEVIDYLAPEKILNRDGRDVTLYRHALIPVVELDLLLNSGPARPRPLLKPRPAGPEFAAPARPGGPAGLTLAANLNSEEAGYFQRPPARPAGPQPLPMVVVTSGERRVCLLVDELVDETEIVVKSLNPRLVRSPYVTGATLLGDGSIVLLLDVPRLVASARQANRSGLRRAATARPPKRILVVDDSITTRELERGILEAHGYRVELADDGTGALEFLRRDRAIDLVISDVEMPVMDGFELTAAIKRTPGLERLPVIIVSSLNHAENKRRGIEAGAQAYITKGEFEQAILLNTIEYLTA